MHGFHKAIEKRIEALERRIGASPTIETDAETNRRLELVAAAHSGHEPADLTESERPVFLRIVATLPIALEILDGGLVGDDGEPALVVHETETEDEDGDDFGEQRYSVGWPRDSPERKGPRGAEYMGA